ncbi:MAG TPA: T9SS type B sorting domain-containing protein, partial [Nitrospiria bacterium]|nr:T9SS type B sorting domain-containing protein [Nitrospiria bacterium]
EIRWDYAPRASGYRVTVSAQGAVLYSNDVENLLSVNPPGLWPSNTELTVTVTPYNRLGPSPTPCPPERFTTGASSVDCEPHRPAITSVPAVVGLCQDRGYAHLTVTEVADGYNWYRIGPDGQESLVGSGRQIQLAETGPHRLEVYNRVGSINEYTLCSSYRDFEVVLTDEPVIRNVQVERDADGLNILVQAGGSIDYEYSLSPDAGFQDSPYFTGLPLQGYTVYVRDPFGCGTTEQEVARNLSPADFPAFFTPNSDGINDLWKFEPPPDLSDAYVETIRIFDRYGNFLAQLDGRSQGWDGNFNGRPLPPSVYWFEAVSLRRELIRGYFALKR